MADENDRKSPTGDEAALAAFFAAARADEPPVPMALLSAILADAAELAAERAPAPAPVARPARRRLGRLFDPLGGWRGATALAACALVGFWIGIAGDIAIDGTSVQAGTTVADSDDPVVEFFDLAALEP